MILHLIACQVFYREVSYLASQSKQITSVSWMPQGMQDTPDLLRKNLQSEIDRLDLALENGTLRHRPDYLLLCYGLCSNGVAGLSSRHYPLVIPRTDDCIGIFLGSQARYLREFSRYPGTYWLNNGWLEAASLPGSQNPEQQRQAYAEQYGEENADFLLEQQTAWVRQYSACGYITSQVCDLAPYREEAKDVAQRNHWNFREIPGDITFLARLLDGDFREEEVLLCPPGKTVTPSYDAKKLTFL